MDGLFSLIWVAFIVVTVVNSINKNKKKQHKNQSAIPPFTAAPTAQKPVTEPARPVVFGEVQKWFTEPPKAEQTRMPLESMKPVPVATPAAPKVHTHLSLDCDRDEPSGSMDFISGEGYDPCHDGELPDRGIPRSGAPVIREQPGLTLDWTRDALVRSVIMQEVLTRPCQRKRR